MKHWETKFQIAALFLVVSPIIRSIDAANYTFDISSPATKINFGEPLFVNLTLRLKQPQISLLTGKLPESVEYGGWILQVQHIDANSPSLFPLLLPLRFRLLDANNLEYSTTVKVFCDLKEEEGKSTAKIIFNKPGAYTFNILDAKKRPSNTLNILVEPSSTGEQALSLLTGPEDFAFLMGGIFKNPTTVSHLEQVVEQCGETMLGRWAAARLGIEQQKEFQQKHRNNVTFAYQYRHKQINEPLLESSYKYLLKALELPDEFPIRKEVLANLIRIEVIKGNYKNALYYANELYQKYPKTKLAKKYAPIKLLEEIVSFENHITKIEQQRQKQTKEIIEWLQQLRQSEDLNDIMTEEQWQQFIETLKQQI